MNRHPDVQKLYDAKADFDRHFKCSEPSHAYISELGGENVIVVENYSKRAYYSFSIELLKVLNLTGTQD